MENKIVCKLCNEEYKYLKSKHFLWIQTKKVKKIYLYESILKQKDA
jgi:hypothetical protein